MIDFIDMVSFFKDRTKVFSFNWSGNFPSMTPWLKFCKIKLGPESVINVVGLALSWVSSHCAIVPS